MTELNPNHRVTRSLHDQWYKIAALLVAKAGGHAVITISDTLALQDGHALAVQERSDGLHLYLVSEAEAQKLASQQGGRPS